jgi:glycosyltransferase involved in cell wall biosynthesis
MGNICVGDFISKWYGTKPTFVSYGAVDLPKIEKIPSHADGAVFIGRLDEQTGILTYAQAVEIIRKKIPGFEFLVVGDGKLRNQISQKNKILNAVGNASKYFMDYKFAFVSRYLSILEAMAAKRLVFAVYDNSIKKDYLKMSAFAGNIIITNSPTKLADEFIYFLNHSDQARRKIEAGFKFAENNTWNNLVKIYLKLWKI